MHGSRSCGAERSAGPQRRRRRQQAACQPANVHGLDRTGGSDRGGHGDRRPRPQPVDHGEHEIGRRDVPAEDQAMVELDREVRRHQDEGRPEDHRRHGRREQHEGQWCQDSETGIMAQQEADLPTYEPGNLGLVGGGEPPARDHAYAEAENLRADDDDRLHRADFGELRHAEVPRQAEGQHEASAGGDRAEDARDHALLRGEADELREPAVPATQPARHVPPPSSGERAWPARARARRGSGYRRLPALPDTGRPGLRSSASGLSKANNDGSK
jgi:hypothetical protein